MTGCSSWLYRPTLSGNGQTKKKSLTRCLQICMSNFNGCREAHMLSLLAASCKHVSTTTFSSTDVMCVCWWYAQSEAGFHHAQSVQPNMLPGLHFSMEPCSCASMVLASEISVCARLSNGCSQRACILEPSYKPCPCGVGVWALCEAVHVIMYQYEPLNVSLD